MRITLQVEDRLVPIILHLLKNRDSEGDEGDDGVRDARMLLECQEKFGTDVPTFVRAEAAYHGLLDDLQKQLQAY